MPDEDGKKTASAQHPETVPWAEYDALKTKVSGLEEQVKTAIKPEDHKKVADELDILKKSSQKAAEDAQKAKDAELETRRAELVKKGVTEAKVKTFTESELNLAEAVTEARKPGADLGGGGGASRIQGSPMELARQAYSKSK